MTSHQPEPQGQAALVRDTQATLDEVWALLNALGLGRGTTIASAQRRLHVNAADAMRLFSLREATMSLANAALARVSAAPEAHAPTQAEVEALRCDGVRAETAGFYNGWHSALDAVLALYTRKETR